MRPIDFVFIDGDELHAPKAPFRRIANAMQDDIHIVNTKEIKIPGRKKSVRCSAGQWQVRSYYYSEGRKQMVLEIEEMKDDG